MLSITFENSEGTSIEMSERFPYVLTDHRGLFANDVTTQTQRGFAQDGAYYFGSLDDARVISLTVVYNYATLLEDKEIQRELLNIFNPQLGLGTLTRTDDEGTYIIEAVVSVKPRIRKIPTGGTKMCKTFDVVFFCPEPDWLSNTEYEETIDGLTGGLIIPMAIPLTIPATSAGKVIQYDGDNPADILFDFGVESGGVSADTPRVENADGEYIEIDKVLLEGERILISTNPDAPSITFINTSGESSDAWEYLVWGSTFFQLEKGTNNITFSADTGSPTLKLTYREHFA